MSNFPTTYSVGFIGEGKYTSKVNGVITKVYDTWIGMLRRCYSKKLHIKYPTYKDCIVAECWHNFQVFGEWFENNYVEGYQLDKDILFKGNKIYSPNTCCFVPKEINSLFLTCKSARGEYPVGVSKDKNKFKSSVSLKNKQVTLGRFDTPEEAFKAYKKAKEYQIKEVATEYYSTGRITLEVYNAIMNYKIEITD